MSILTRRMALKNLSLVALARTVGMDRGELSRVLHEGRNCQEKFRQPLLEAVGATVSVQEQVLGSSERADKGLSIDDEEDASPLDRKMNSGLSFIFRQQYRDALNLFLEVLTTAGQQHEPLYEAHAYSRMAWVHFEMGNLGAFKSAFHECMRALKAHFRGVELEEVLGSLHPGSASALCTPGDRVSLILQETLHLAGKYYTELATYVRTDDGAIAQEMFDNCAIVDRFNANPNSSAHTLRWMAVLLAKKGGRDNVALAKQHLKDCGKLFLPKENGPVYLARDTGAVHFWAEEKPQARRLLKESVELFQDFNDPRGLGPVFWMLSRLAETTAEKQQYALAGAALHPFHFVRTNALLHFPANTRPTRAQSAAWEWSLQQLYHGLGPFKGISELMARVHRNVGLTSDQVLRANLAKLFHDPYHNGEADFRLSHLLPKGIMVPGRR